MSGADYGLNGRWVPDAASAGGGTGGARHGCDRSHSSSAAPAAVAASTDTPMSAHHSDTPMPAPASAETVPSALLDVFENTAYNLWMAALRLGQRWPEGMAMYERMAHPRVGDLVLEISSFRLLRVKHRGFGVLLSIDGDPEAFETKWVIRLTVDGSTMEWSNAKFIAIPAEVHDWYPTFKSAPERSKEEATP